MAFLLGAAEALEGLGGAEALSSGSLASRTALSADDALSMLHGVETAVDRTAALIGPRITTNNPLAVDPVISQTVVTPTNPSFISSGLQSRLVTIRPTMQTNVGLLKQEGVPTWTSTRTPDPKLITGFVREGASDEVIQNTQNEAYIAQEARESDLPENQNFLDDFGKGFKALRAMSLNEIVSLVSSSSRAIPRGNVAGSIISSGINWGHDAAITSQVQAGQRQMQRDQNAWQGEQNQNSYANQQKMQATDIANRQSMQNADFQHQDAMQSRQFGQDTAMQQARFGQQSTMQQGQFQHENTMQQASFSNQTAQNNLDFSHNKALGAMNIMGNIANTATGGLIGGAFSTINTAINAGVGYLEQGRNQQFQREMQTSNFNNSIYASGNSATALKIATPTA